MRACAALKLMCQALWLHCGGMSLQHLHSITIHPVRGTEVNTAHLSACQRTLRKKFLVWWKKKKKGLFFAPALPAYVLLCWVDCREGWGRPLRRYSWLSSAKEQLFQNQTWTLSRGATLTDGSHTHTCDFFGSCFPWGGEPSRSLELKCRGRTKKKERKKKMPANHFN